MSTFLRDLSMGLLTVALLIFAKVLIEPTPYGQWLNIRGYEILHSFIPIYDPDENIPVIVLDITDLKNDSQGIPPNEQLKVIVEGLIQSKAKAIAIDIDYSPKNEPTTSKNYFAKTEANNEFMKFIHEQKDREVPIFVGAGNAGAEPKKWLGLERNKNLAADIIVDPNNSLEIPAWVQCDESNPETRLKSLSKSLADVTGKLPHAPSWLTPFLQNYEEKENLKLVTKYDENENEITCNEALTLVNYAKLSLIEKLSLHTLSKESIFWAKNTDGSSKFENKLVLIGDGQMGRDSITVNGKNIPGVFVHASATYTLVSNPIYRFKHWVSISLDALLGLFIVTGVLVYRSISANKNEAASDAWEKRFVMLFVFSTLVAGIAMVKFGNILWLDFLLVIFALFLHPRIQKRLAIILQNLFQRFIKGKNQSKPEDKE